MSDGGCFNWSNPAFFEHGGDEESRYLLSRLDGLGAGVGVAARRRGWAVLQEMRMEKERRAHCLSLSQGRLPLRWGEFLLH